MNKTAFLVLLALPSAALGSDYARCILDHAQSVQNDAAAHAVHQLCMDKFPDGLAAVEQGAGRGLFSYSSGAECMVKKGARTRSRIASLSISQACDRLYDPPPDPRAADRLFEDLQPRR